MSAIQGFISPATLATLSVVVLTYNEERNLGACLESVTGWAREVLVVDSGSTDRTVAIAQRYGASITEHPFEGHAKQWNWALENLPISTEWILALDADQRVTADLRDEISRLLGGDHFTIGGPEGYFIKRKQIFRGRWIRHGGYYPKYLLKLFRRGGAWADENDLVDHHFCVKGEAGKLQCDIVEDNENESSISVWVEKHNRYAALQAWDEINRPQHSSRGFLRGFCLGSPDERVRWVKNMWNRLPLYVRPLLYFFYRYVVRLGMLDGKEGFIFHFLQAFWYRLLVDINIDQLRRTHRLTGS